MAGERVWDGEGEMVTSWPAPWGPPLPAEVVHKGHIPRGWGAASQHTHESHPPPFPSPLIFSHYFFILTEGLQHQGLCWSRQRNCLNNLAFDLFCFHLFSSELAGQRLIPIRQKISARCGMPGSGGAAGPGLHRLALLAGLPHTASRAAHSSIPHQSLQHPMLAAPAAPR